MSGAVAKALALCLFAVAVSPAAAQNVVDENRVTGPAVTVPGIAVLPSGRPTRCSEAVFRVETVIDGKRRMVLEVNRNNGITLGYDTSISEASLAYLRRAIHNDLQAGCTYP